MGKLDVGVGKDFPIGEDKAARECDDTGHKHGECDSTGPHGPHHHGHGHGCCGGKRRRGGRHACCEK